MLFASSHSNENGKTSPLYAALLIYFFSIELIAVWHYIPHLYICLLSYYLVARLNREGPSKQGMGLFHSLPHSQSLVNAPYTVIGK